MEKTANKAVCFSGTISLWNIFLSLICNSSSVSSSSDHLPKNTLNYRITEDGGHGECRTLHLLQKCCVIHALFPAVRRAIPWDKCSLQDSSAKQCQPLCTSDACPAAALGFSPTLGNALLTQVLGRVMQPHPSDPTWSQWGSGRAYPAWSSAASVVPDLSWIVQSHGCSASAWPSSGMKRNSVRLWSDLQAATPAGIDDCSSSGVARTAVTRCSTWPGDSSRAGATEPALACNEGCRQWSWFLRDCHP